jgi:Fe-S-cluster containining protein
MKLEILQPAPASPRQTEPWYAGGLRFTCQQCGNCCTGGPGYVWISVEEVSRLAALLQLTESEVVEQYCRKIDGKLSLRERRNRRGEYDCIFLEERGAKRICTIYVARPLQCRTWPFWSENLKSAEAWARSARRCAGMDVGRKYSPEQIEALRDAKDWPQRPPTSG